MKKFLVFLCAMSLVFGMFVGVANAVIIDVTLPEYNGAYYDTTAPYPLDPVLVGTFTYDLMWEQIVYAEISGQWGNATMPTTARNELFVDDLLVADTDDYSPDPYSAYYTPWTFVFSDFTVLEDGVAEFSAVQTSEYVIRLAPTTLHIETAPVPEPSTMLLLGAGLVGLLGLGRKKLFRK